MRILWHLYYLGMIGPGSKFSDNWLTQSKNILNFVLSYCCTQTEQVHGFYIFFTTVIVDPRAN